MLLKKIISVHAHVTYLKTEERTGLFYRNCNKVSDFLTNHYHLVDNWLIRKNARKTIVVI